MTRKTSPYAAKCRRLAQTVRLKSPWEMAKASPVGKTVQKKEQIDSVAELMSMMTAIGCRIYLTQDGEIDRLLLSHLAVVLGVGAEVSHALAPKNSESKRLLAALRTVVQFSADGGRWRSSQAVILHTAAELAGKVFLTQPALGAGFFPGAFELADKIRNGTARMSDVAGPEIYNQPTEVSK
jgi:hypothetical protein